MHLENKNKQKDIPVEKVMSEKDENKIFQTYKHIRPDY